MPTERIMPRTHTARGSILPTNKSAHETNLPTHEPDLGSG